MALWGYFSIPSFNSYHGQTPSTTMDIYSHALPTMQHGAIEKLDGVFQVKPSIVPPSEDLSS